MKKRILTLTLALIMCLTLAPSAAFAVETTEKVSIKIPGCNAVFTLENVSSEYVVATSSDGIPAYRFALPGIAGKVTCDEPADIEFGQSWKDADPQNSGAGGGGGEQPAGWSESYPAGWLELDGKGLQTIELVVHDDGTLEGWDKPVVAKIVFFFGYPISMGSGDLPDDLISWEWKSTDTADAMAGGPPVIEHVNLPKFPVSELAVAPVADTPSSWAVEQVNAAVAAGLVPEGLRSRYTQATTRAEFCALAVALYENVMGEKITGRFSFTDSTDVNVEKMASLGVVSGVGDGRFSPNNKLTREQAATMLSRLAAAIGKPLTGQPPAFADNASVSPWAFDAVGQMQATGIMSGVGNNTFAPASSYTREQSIVTILRLNDAMMR